jgi:hypothetical protein
MGVLRSSKCIFELEKIMIFSSKHDLPCKFCKRQIISLGEKFIVEFFYCNLACELRSDTLLKVGFKSEEY